MRQVWIETIEGQTRMLVVEDGELVELAVDQSDQRSLVGNIYLARVENVLPGMGSAFVNIGQPKNAYLSLNDLPPALSDLGNGSGAAKSKPLKSGQTAMVQVIKEPGGDKGPRVTMSLTFPGKYLVLLPTIEAIGVSRHIQDEARRKGLTSLAKTICPPGAGIIIRTAAEQATDTEIASDLESLTDRWRVIESRAKAQAPPALLLSDGGLVARAERDLNAEIMKGQIPDVLEDKLSKALRRKVWLASGAFLVFDRLEAMTVIDVNSGKFLGGKHVAETIRNLNIEAAKEIARQVRLRDLGGIIIIDFVDMEQDEDREAVLSAFTSALMNDRAKRHIHGFTAAGLLEMTRRPVFRAVDEVLRMPCPHCHGEGTVPSPAEAVRLKQKAVRREGGEP